MRDFKPGILEAVGVDGIAVVLACNFYLSGLKIFYRMIAAAVSELQLVCVGAVGKAYHLMAQTYTEDRIFAAQGLYHIYNRHHVLRIARTV